MSSHKKPTGFSGGSVMRDAEYSLQVAICDYLRLLRPPVLWQSDLSGLKLPIGQAVKARRIKFGPAWPDLFLAEPRGDYHGLFVELKARPDEIYTKAGQLRQGRHIRKQAEFLELLRVRGFRAEFACGFDQTRRLIDEYLAGIVICKWR